MYNSQLVSQQIKALAKRKGVTINQLLFDCELGKNTITKMANGTDILTQNLYKIADYLDCSVDYLLGRNTKDSLTEKQRKLIELYESLDEDYQVMIDKKIEQFTQAQAEDMVFEKVRQREVERLKESLAEERKEEPQKVNM